MHRTSIDKNEKPAECANGGISSCRHMQAIWETETHQGGALLLSRTRGLTFLFMLSLNRFFTPRSLEASIVESGSCVTCVVAKAWRFLSQRPEPPPFAHASLGEQEGSSRIEWVPSIFR